MRLQPAVLADLARHGIAPAGADDPAALRERLNDRYLEAVRQLRERQRRGDIPLPEYAAAVESLKRSFSLLGLPLALWVQPQTGSDASRT